MIVFKRLIAFVVTISSFLLLMLPAPFSFAATKVNVAQGKAVTVSSTLDGYFATNAVDGKVPTVAEDSAGKLRWICGDTDTNPTLDIDLGGTYIIDSAALYSGSADENPTLVMTNFVLQRWDIPTGTWIDISGSKYSNVTVSNTNMTFTAPVETTKVRLTSKINAGARIRVRELMIYGAQTIGNLRTSNISAANITLNWDKPNNTPTPIASFDIYRNAQKVTNILNSSAAPTFVDSDILESKKYTYTVKALNAVNDLLFERSLTVYGVSTIPAPSNFTVTSNTYSSLSFSWEAPPNLNVIDYTIYRDNTEIGTTTTASYTDTAIVLSTTYSYTVIAHIEGDSYSQLSSPFSITTPAINPPSALRLQSASHEKVTISWDASPINIDSYKIYRDNTEIATVNASTLSYTDRVVTGSKTYTYSVKAFIQSLSSTAIALSVTTPANPDANIGIDTTVKTFYSDKFDLGSYVMYGLTITEDTNLARQGTKSFKLTWPASNPGGQAFRFEFPNESTIDLSSQIAAGNCAFSLWVYAKTLDNVNFAFNQSGSVQNISLSNYLTAADLNRWVPITVKLAPSTPLTALKSIAITSNTSNKELWMDNVKIVTLASPSVQSVALYDQSGSVVTTDIPNRLSAITLNFNTKSRMNFSAENISAIKLKSVEQQKEIPTTASYNWDTNSVTLVPATILDYNSNYDVNITSMVNAISMNMPTWNSTFKTAVPSFSLKYKLKDSQGEEFTTIPPSLNAFTAEITFNNHLSLAQATVIVALYSQHTMVAVEGRAVTSPSGESVISIGFNDLSNLLVDQIEVMAFDSFGTLQPIPLWIQ